MYNEDCLGTMAKMPDNFVDLVVTSPPYNKNGFREGKKETRKSSGKWKRWDNASIEYDNYDDNLTEHAYWLWQNKLFNEFYRILKPSGSLFYNHKVRRYNSKAHHPLIGLQQNRMQFYQQIIWDRGSGVDNNLAYLQPTTELILWFVKDKPKVSKANAFLRTEVWYLMPDMGNKHPAPFPLKLAANCILLASAQNDIIYDPFMGSGTTAIACINNDRNFIGSEISKEYVDLANKRIGDHKAQYKLL